VGADSGPNPGCASGPAQVSRRGFGAWAAVTTVAAGSACDAATPIPVRPKPVGFVLSHEQFRTTDLVGFAEQAERAGFGYVWASDHLQPWQDNEGHSMSPWLTLALVSQRTQRITLGSGVTCPSYRHHPSEVAQAFASLGILAPSRVFLGVGSGEAVNELAGTGQYGRYRERHDRLVEAIELIRRLWSGQRLSFRGRYFSTDQLRLYDVPDHPPPLYVAASGPRSARLAGRYGDGWITQSAGVTDPRLRQAFADGAHAADRDAATMPKLAETFAVVGDQADIDDAAELWRFTTAGSDQPNPVAIQRHAEQAASVGQVVSQWTTGPNPDVHLAALQRLLAAGAIPFVHAPQRNPEKLLSFYGDKVLPRLSPR
jgi:TAT-translocated FGD2 family F420-dependent dehydrogenase